MICKICGTQLDFGFEETCPVKIAALPGNTTTHYSFTDKGTGNQGYKSREAFILHGLLMINIVYLEGGHRLIVVDQTKPPSNSGYMFDVQINVDVDKVKNLSKQDLLDKLNLYQVFS